MARPAAKKTKPAPKVENTFASAISDAPRLTDRKAAQAKFPRANIQTVTKLPFMGLYELIVNGEVVYSDENFDYIIYEGNLIDVKNDRNFTEERKRKLAMIPFDELPLDLAFKKVKGKGERKMAVFTDPDCPFGFTAQRQELKLLWHYGEHITARRRRTPRRLRPARRRPACGSGL